MEWYWALLLMLGMLVVLLAIGVPVAFAFFFINFVGAWIFLGGDAGEQRREVDEPVVEAQQGYSSILRSFS